MAENNVVPITCGKRGLLDKFIPGYYRGKNKLTRKMSQLQKEEDFLSTMFLASKVLEEVESNGVRKMVVITNTGGKWVSEYSGITSPQEMIDALQDLWFSATGINTEEGDDIA